MKSALTIGLSIIAMTAFVGCGGKKSSGNKSNGQTFSQGNCSQDVLDVHADLMNKSERPIHKGINVNHIHQNCTWLKAAMGNNSCNTGFNQSRQTQFISYSQVSNFCTEVESYVSQRNPPPRPIPVPSPSPNPRPPRYQNILMEDFDPRFALYFEKSYLDANDLDKRTSQVRCHISVPVRSNGSLRNIRTRFTAYNVTKWNGLSTYDLTTMVMGSGELVRLVCKSQSPRLTIYDVNIALDGVAEIRQR